MKGDQDNVVTHLCKVTLLQNCNSKVLNLKLNIRPGLHIRWIVLKIVIYL